MATPELLSAVNTLSRKVDLLLETQSRLLERIKNLEASNEELQRQHEIDVASLEKAKKDIEYLSISHRLAYSPEALMAARRKVEQLIRTINNCIRLIKED